MIIAIANAVSAAAMPIENNVKNMPSSSPGNRKRLKITKFRSTEFSISSSDIRIAIRFLLVIKPNTPQANISKLGMRYISIVSSIIQIIFCVLLLYHLLYMPAARHLLPQMATDSQICQY